MHKFNPLEVEFMCFSNSVLILYCGKRVGDVYHLNDDYIGWQIQKSYRRKNIVFIAAQSLISNFPLIEFKAVIRNDNFASIKLAKRLGFTYCKSYSPATEYFSGQSLYKKHIRSGGCDANLHALS